MFGTIQKYILRNTVGFLLLCAAIVIGLTIMMDFVQRFEEFSRLLEESNKTWLFAFRYYTLRIPLYIAWLMPVILLAAAGITVVYMTRENEFVPFFMSGYSIYNLLMPIFLLSFFFTLVTFSVHQWILPGVSTNFVQTEELLDEGSEAKEILTGTGEGTYVQFSRLNLVENTGKDILLVVIHDGYLRTLARAKRGKYLKERTQWILYEGRVTYYNREGFRKKPSEHFDDKGFTSPELKDSELSPSNIITRESNIKFQTLGELSRQITKFPDIPSIRVQFHNRISYPLVVFLLPLAGIPILMRREITSYFVGSLICAGLAIGFYLIQILFMELGNRGIIHPVPSCWFPVGLLAVVALYFYDSILT